MIMKDIFKQGRSLLLVIYRRVYDNIGAKIILYYYEEYFSVYLKKPLSYYMDNSSNNLSSIQQNKIAVDKIYLNDVKI